MLRARVPRIATIGLSPINGVASGDFPLSGSAVGSVVINGVASGDFPLSGLATGTVTGEGSALTPNGGARREYRPYYYELQNRRKIERKFEEAELDLKATENKIEALELKRTRDLADELMQEELLALLARQNELIRIINDLQQQKLMVMRDDEDFIAILMYLN